MRQKLLCWIGLHAWEQTRPIDPCTDSFPNPYWPYEAPIRTCGRCGKRQKWLPGYGGSEIGCWMTTRKGN